MGFSTKPSIKRTQPSAVFGPIHGVPVGSTFENRLFLHHSSVHSGILAGISGSKDAGCYSVVLSGGYEDDKDEGYRFTYTGCGGRDKKNGEKPRDGPQTCDQSWKNSRNASLLVSARTKKPVRVVRGYKSSSDWAPAQGYRYDGLYQVDEAWMDTGKSGFQVCKFRLSRLPDQPPIPRRQGTLNLDLSQWERPRHFGGDSIPSDDESPGPAAPRLPKQKIHSAKGKKRADADDDGDAGPSNTAAPVKRLPAKPAAPLASPIPPTTNMAGARRFAAQPQTSTSAPDVDINNLLAEMRGGTSKSSVPMPPQALASARTDSLPKGSKPSEAGPSRPVLPNARDQQASVPTKRPTPSTAPVANGEPTVSLIPNASPNRRKRSWDGDVHGLDDHKRAKVDLPTSAGAKVVQGSPKRACPSSER
ncbi:hypothetical protein DICSQDRAFT_100629 [Dichomitus squalens LYAD-421 SS1]|uniref:uncharacterized protein n=1 Tax=Dichomitus squalens (strain LYAD-421) TaxID=732165 RepID=UPI00044132B1|nr:uncharacterized protein DICSQDRAFT_100629 [Dichomitus squalens LYAD-421 SS1]EJF64044.1 hypothetical protein DICSQDRAFT_100629 [Dichomitus squalens LYAD-421 SS1]